MLDSITWNGLRNDTRQALWRTMQDLERRARDGPMGGSPPEVWLAIKKVMASEPTKLSSETELQALLLWVNETRRTLVAKAGGATAPRDAETTEILAELIVLQAQVKALPIEAQMDADASP